MAKAEVQGQGAGRGDAHAPQSLTAADRLPDTVGLGSNLHFVRRGVARRHAIAHPPTLLALEALDRRRGHGVARHGIERQQPPVGALLNPWLGHVQTGLRQRWQAGEDTGDEDDENAKTHVGARTYESLVIRTRYSTIPDSTSSGSITERVVFSASEKPASLCRRADAVSRAGRAGRGRGRGPRDWPGRRGSAPRARCTTSRTASSVSLPERVRGRSATWTILRGTWLGRGAAADLLSQALLEVVVQTLPWAQPHEQHHPHIVGEALTDDQALDHLVESFDLTVDLGRADAYATRVEGGVGATVNDQAASRRRSAQSPWVQMPGKRWK